MLVSAVGCSDLVPPSDAWLKRSDNVATVGCYMTRQTWILTCDQTGRWTGTFGNCTQRTTTFTNSTLFNNMSFNFVVIIRTLHSTLRLLNIDRTIYLIIYWFLELLAIQDSSDVVIRPAESQQQTTADVKGNGDDSAINKQMQVVTLHHTALVSLFILCICVNILTPCATAVFIYSFVYCRNIIWLIICE